jgi:hypothetical protein
MDTRVSTMRVAIRRLLAPQRRMTGDLKAEVDAVPSRLEWRGLFWARKYSGRFQKLPPLRARPTPGFIRMSERGASRREPG